VVGWLQLKPLLSSLGKSDIPGASLYRSMDFEKHVGVMERFREQFHRMVGSLPSSSARVVVFIDDLDRCEPDKALQLLDVIKIFLDAPRCVFVLGLDLGVIQKALERKYPQDEAAQREYLSKIIQLPFHLPPPTKADLATYLDQLDVRFPDQRCGEVFLGAVAQNPREIKRLINTYSLNWYLAQARVGGAVTPVRLAKVIVIQQAYGALFSLLRERPDWLALLERAMRDSVADGPPEGGGMTRDMGSAGNEATVLVSAAGIAVPPAVLPFVDNPRLQALLTLHPQLPLAEDDANFSQLSADDIAVYFSLAGQTSSSAPEGGDLSLGDLAGSTAPSSEYPNFGPRYQVLGRLGTGGIGEVFLAQDVPLGRQVAIKRLHVTLMAETTWAERFHREIRLLQRIKPHPNVVQLLDAGVVSGAGGETPFYVMENNGGRTLGDLLTQGPLSEAQLRQFLLPMFSALEHVHGAGIIHGDVKPASIVVTPAGVPKLIDFGLAFLGEEGRDNLTQVGSVIATMRYASPEQMLGRRIDARADLFSLGIVIYQALTGQTPFAGETVVEAAQMLMSGDVAAPSQLNGAAPAGMDPFISRILASDPEARFATAAEAGAAFEAALGAGRGGVAAAPPA
jgi:tRNA A-37 threonylcarbamoyl transferase component Bud32